MDLPVHIGFGDMIQIDEGQGADPAARQGFCSPRSDATDPHHHGMRRTNAGCRRLTVTADHSAKTALGIGRWRRDIYSTSRRTGLCIRFRGQGSNTVEPVVLRPSRSR